MSAPFISDPVTDPINIDPGVAYAYVIPVEGATSLGFEPVADLTITLAGNTLSVTYSGPTFIGDASLVIPVKIFASNVEGTAEQTLNFQIQQGPDIPVIISDASADINFPDGMPGYLSVDDQIVFRPNPDWTGRDADLEFNTAGSAINPGTWVIKSIVSDNMTVSWPTSSDTAHTVALTPSFPSSHYFARPVTSYPRIWPKITSAAYLTKLPGESISYAITDDSSADGYAVRGLPQLMRLETDTITGYAPDVPGLYPIIIEARKGSAVSFRYLLLRVH